MLPPVILVRVRSYATSTAVCTRFGFCCMRREIQTMVAIVSPVANSR
jgi:hypothetical protein